MIGGNNDFNECYNRINYWHNKLLEHRRTKKGRPIYAYAQPYRNPFGKANEIPMWQLDMAQWCNKRMIFCTTKFEDFSPRKGFKCKKYLEEYDTQELILNSK